MARRKQFKLRLPSRTLELGARTLVMGVLNVTPDSFSDGGKFFSLNRAIDAALAMEAAGADILDIGGESTRPGSNAISTREELARVLPVLNRLSGRLKIPISIDTRRSAIADAAIAAGAQIINDVTGLRFDPEIAGVACRNHVPLILMHMRGEPRTMQEQPFARNAVRDVLSGLKRSIAIALKVGVPKSQIIVDPGIGFGKSFRQNYELIARLGEIASLGFPILIGTSRKTFLGTTLDGKPPEDRIWGTAATVAASILAGAHIVRVHDVNEMVQVARVTDKVFEAMKPAKPASVVGAGLAPPAGVTASAIVARSRIPGGGGATKPGVAAAAFSFFSDGISPNLNQNNRDHRTASKYEDTADSSKNKSDESANVRISHCKHGLVMRLSVIVVPYNCITARLDDAEPEDQASGPAIDIVCFGHARLEKRERFLSLVVYHRKRQAGHALPGIENSPVEFRVILIINLVVSGRLE